MIDKIITYNGQQGEYKIHIVQSDRFSPCTQKELQNSPLGTDITMLMPEGFDLQKVPAIILKGEVLKEDQLKLQLELNHTRAYSSPEALIDDLLQKEAAQMYPDAKITAYSTRTCNHFQRQQCFLLSKK
jgi:hypothetical protein